mmetsp:Transcript_7369/g.18885  ORF Transcript_7369/g.18885 Transcript_7369/m.18885 type:complete len:221 (+) Transcript_7369:849-1511(+)
MRAWRASSCCLLRSSAWRWRSSWAAFCAARRSSWMRFCSAILASCSALRAASISSCCLFFSARAASRSAFCFCWGVMPTSAGAPAAGAGGAGLASCCWLPPPNMPPKLKTCVPCWRGGAGGCPAGGAGALAGGAAAGAAALAPPVLSTNRLLATSARVDSTPPSGFAATQTMKACCHGSPVLSTTSPKRSDPSERFRMTRSPGLRLPSDLTKSLPSTQPI